MTRSEQGIVLGALFYTAVYIPCFFAFFLIRAIEGQFVSLIVPVHILGLVLNLVAFLVTLRDLYLRKFRSKSAKVIWALLILMTGGIGWVVYIFKYALKPRHEVPSSGIGE